MVECLDAVRDLEELKTGISDSGLKLTQSKVLAMKVPCPSVERQRQIVRRIETACAWIDRLAKEATSADDGAVRTSVPVARPGTT